MSGLLFTEEHEWIAPGANSIATVGISDYAQEQLGELVFVELPDVDFQCVRGGELAVIESVKAASDLFAPVSGVVETINELIIDEPGTVNTDPLGDGWFVTIRMTDESELEGLMDEDAYREFVEGLA
ncbi:MAG: glycine cleavage system protein GcvH [Gammaproteobacteria bacterium]|nr:glycine cleavage system protein GcvH [Gammaproteobacteria bacterium]